MNDIWLYGLGALVILAVLAFAIRKRVKRKKEDDLQDIYPLF